MVYHLVVLMARCITNGVLTPQTLTMRSVDVNAIRRQDGHTKGDSSSR